MKPGFLLIDQHMNTIIIERDDPDIVEFLRYKPGYPSNIDKAKTHDTFKDLDKDVHAYVRGTYLEKGETA